MPQTFLCSAILTLHLGSRAQALKNAVNVTSTPTNTSAADEALVAELEALISLSDDEVSGAASPSQPTLDLSASTPAIEATPANNSSVAELDTLLSSSTPSDVADQFTPSDSKRNTSYFFMQCCIDLAFRFPDLYVGHYNRNRNSLSGVVCNGG